MDIMTNNGQFNRYTALLIGDRPYATNTPDKRVESAIYYTIDEFDQYWTQLQDLEDQTIMSVIVLKKELDYIENAPKWRFNIEVYLLLARAYCPARKNKAWLEYQWNLANKWKDNSRKAETKGMAKSFRLAFPCLGKLKYIKKRKNAHTVPLQCARSFLPTKFIVIRQRCRSPTLQSDFGLSHQKSDWRKYHE